MTGHDGSWYVFVTRYASHLFPFYDAGVWRVAKVQTTNGASNSIAFSFSRLLHSNQGSLGLLAPPLPPQFPP